MASIIDTIKNMQTMHNIYNTQINGLLKSLCDEILDDSNKLMNDKITQIIYNTQIELIDKISQDYNISNRELQKKYVTKPKKEKKSKDNLLQMIDSVNSFDNLANLSNQSILSNLTNQQLDDKQSEINNQEIIKKLQHDEQFNENFNNKGENSNFDNFIDIEDSPTMKGINCMKNVVNEQFYSDEEDIINLLVQNKKNTLQQNMESVIETKKDSTNTQVPKKRGRRSKKLIDINQTNTSNVTHINETETSQTYEIIYKSLTIKGKNYLLNLSTNEIFDMENILVGKKKGDKILFKKNVLVV